ncbi:MAG: GGDEF domain-containing protein [Paucibacter sp.]|nr:GGDEF domain-containing protein [Roseateles sp.]
MRYLQSKIESNELLRLALPQMSRWGSGCQPPSYTLWYEYALGSNGELKKALDERMLDSSPLSVEETHKFYGRFIADRDIAATGDLQAELERTLSQLGQLANRAGDDASHYGQSLQDCGMQLSDQVDIDAVRGVIQALAAETRRMQDSNSRLKSELDLKGRELREISSKLDTVRSEALLDPLTGLANRRGFQRAIDNALGSQGDGLSGWAMLMVDIDHFKKVNDTHGHLLGDRVLQAVARVLKNCIKGRDMAVRLGGEEFAIVLPDTTPAGALSLAEDIRQTISRGVIKRNDGGVIGSVTVSIGVAAYKVAETLETWIERADQALYASKGGGRNRVTLAGA